MTGDVGCWSNYGEIKKVMETISPIFGFLMISAGIILTFFGKRFYSQMFSFLMFFLATAVIFGALYNFLINKNSPAYVIWAFLVMSIISGFFAAKLSFNFAQLHMAKIVASAAGLAIGF